LKCTTAGFLRLRGRTNGPEAEPIKRPMAACAGLRCVERSIEKVAAPPATSRHPNHSLPLLPSGPGGVCELSSREDRRSHHKIGDVIVWKSRKWRRERDSNPRNGLTRLHTFQACSFNRSDISPLNCCGGRDCSAHPEPHPSLRSGPACGCPNSFPTNLSNPRNGLTRLHTFQACSFNRSDTSPHLKSVGSAIHLHVQRGRGGY
jgi:hypothetical protein